MVGRHHQTACQKGCKGSRLQTDDVPSRPDTHPVAEEGHSFPGCTAAADWGYIAAACTDWGTVAAGLDAAGLDTAGSQTAADWDSGNSSVDIAAD